MRNKRYNVSIRRARPAITKRSIAMDFRNLTVKELFDNPDTAAVIKELAPQLLKYPIKLLGKKKCGEIFDKVVATGIVPEAIAKEAEARINKILAS